FLGFVTDEEKRRLLRAAWAVVFPSPKEGWGISNVEAAACGTPAIASDSPGLRESVRHGETGFLVPHGDAGALAERMLALAADPALVTGLAPAARAFAERLSWVRAALISAAHLGLALAGACSGCGAPRRRSAASSTSQTRGGGAPRPRAADGGNGGEPAPDPRPAGAQGRPPAARAAHRGDGAGPGDPVGGSVEPRPRARGLHPALRGAPHPHPGRNRDHLPRLARRAGAPPVAGDPDRKSTRLNS